MFFMKKLHFSIKIDAPAQKVWDTMLNKDTYEQWTNVFNPSGSSFEGSWDKGSQIRFIATGDDKENGMLARIAENKPHQFLSIEHYGEIVDGVEDTTSDRVKAWQGAHENYTFKTQGETTTVEIDVDTNEEYSEMFSDTWPKALQELKRLCETN